MEKAPDNSVPFVFQPTFVRILNHATLLEENVVLRSKKMTTGWPDEYYAVIFTTQRTDAEMAMYGLTSERMIELAQQQPGFLGLESVREDNGLGITVSYWRDREAIAAWGDHAEHRVAQALGRKEFYSWFQLRIAKVTEERSFGLDDLLG